MLEALKQRFVRLFNSMFNFGTTPTNLMDVKPTKLLCRGEQLPQALEVLKSLRKEEQAKL